MRWLKALKNQWRWVCTNQQGFGGGSPPPAPDTQETTAEALQAELEYGPELARQRAALSEELSPGQTALMAQLLEDYGPQLGAGMYEARAAMAPELTALEDETTATIRERLGEGDDDIMDAYRREFAAAEASAGRLGAPVGSFNMARQSVAAREGLMQSRINEALAATGKVPITASPNIQPYQADTSSNFLAPMLGHSASVYGTNMGGYNAQQAQQGQIMGSIFGGIGSMGGAWLGK